MNQVVLIGRLTKAPELRYTPSNIAVATFTLAVDRPRRQDKEQEADFINVVVWSAQAENCSKYLDKGSLVAVDGRIQTRSYDGQDGKRKYATEVVATTVQFLESKKGKAQSTVKNSDTDTQNAQSNTEYCAKVKEDPFSEIGKQVEAELSYGDDWPF